MNGDPRMARVSESDSSASAKELFAGAQSSMEADDSLLDGASTRTVGAC